MKLEPRVNRLEKTNPVPVTAEMLFAEMATMTVYDDERVAALSRRMPEEELEAAIAKIKRLIEERDA